jgi:hypothetical protein
MRAPDECEAVGWEVGWKGRRTPPAGVAEGRGSRGDTGKGKKAALAA